MATTLERRTGVGRIGRGGSEQAETRFPRVSEGGPRVPNLSTGGVVQAPSTLSLFVRASSGQRGDPICRPFPATEALVSVSTVASVPFEGSPPRDAGTE